MADEPDRAGLLAEAYKRDLLPPDQKGAYEEAIKRGLAVAIPGPGYVPESAGQAFASGLRDPLEGAAQTLSHLTPAPIEHGVNAANNWLAEKTGLVAPLPPGGMDESVRQREEGIKKSGGDGTARMMGNLVSPMNLVPGAAMGKGAGVVGRVARAGGAGAMGGAMEPTTSDSFWTSKAGQTGAGLTAGFILGAAGEGASAAVWRLGEYLAREYPENVTNHAVQTVLRRIDQDAKAGGPTAKDAIDLVNAAAAQGKPMALVDVVGKNTKGLAGNVARQPGPSRGMFDEFLTQRDENAAQRLKDDVAKYVHGGDTMHKTAEALLRARSAAARPAYAEMERQQNVWSPRLQQFLDDPALKRGMARGYEIERLQALAEGRKFDPTQSGMKVDAEGNVELIRTPNMRVLDLGKQGLDAMIADERHELTGRLTNRGVALEKVRQAYVNLLDDLDTSGSYKRARQAWAGPSASLDALRAGRTVFLNSPEENAAALKNLSEGDREFYRIGVADMIREKLAKTGLSGDEAKAIIKNPWTRDQLRPVFRTPEEFNGFVDSVTAETKMFDTKFKVLGGSQTAERLAEDQSSENTLAAGGAKMAEKLATGSWLGAGKAAYDLYRDLGVAPSKKLNENIAKILLTTEFKDGSELAQRLRGEFKGPPPINRLRSPSEAFLRGSGMLSPGIGGLVGRE